MKHEHTTYYKQTRTTETCNRNAEQISMKEEKWKINMKVKKIKNWKPLPDLWSIDEDSKREMKANETKLEAKIEQLREWEIGNKQKLF